MNVENIYFLISAIGTPLIFLIGYYVFLKDSRRTINKLFFLMSLGGTFWGLEGIVMRFVVKTSLIYIFTLLVAWFGSTFLSSVFLQLSLAIVGKEELLKKKITKFLLLSPPVLMLLFLYTDTIISEFFPRYEMDIEKVYPFFNIYLPLYFISYLLIAIVILLKKYFSLQSYQERNKFKFFIIGTFIPAIFGSLTLFILPAIFKIESGWLSFSFFALGYLFIAQGVLRYGLFIDYREILETIFKRLAELVIVTDKEGLILLTNEITLAKLNFKEEEISSQNISNFFKTKEAWPSLKEKLKKQGEALEEKLVFLTKEKEEIPFLVSVSEAKEGIIFIGRDIKELLSYQEKLKEEVERRTKELKEAKTILEVKVKARTKELQELADSLEEQVKQRTKELQKRVEELERFHRLTVGRERRMIELKKEIEDLKKHLMMRKEKI